MSYGTMTSAFHMAMCHMVPRPVLFTWQCVKRYHKQCNMTMRHTVPRLVQHDNAPYGKTTSVFHMAICHTVPRPVSFTWQYVILRPAPFTWHKGWKFNSKFWRGVLFQWLGKALWFSPDTAFERRHLKKKINQKTKMAICTKRENVIGVNRRHFYQVVAV